jgi:CheY-like chemotaxis protein
MYRQQESQLALLEEPTNNYVEKKKILFVDNDIASYYLAMELLNNYNIHLIHATCGYSAIRLFIENAYVDTVITELKVPRVDGFGLLSKFKMINPEIPVIVQTATVYSGMKQKCLKAGFNDFIAKPIDFELFINVFTKHLLLVTGKN